MLSIRRVLRPLSFVLAIVTISACSSATSSTSSAASTTAVTGSTSVTSAPTVPTLSVVAPTIAAGATTDAAISSEDVAAAVAADNAVTDNSPCIGVQPTPGETISPNGGGQWAAPDQVIDANHTYCAILTTNHGRIVFALFAKTAPKNVNSFVFLAKKGFYENISWHRVISGFMAQTGDPTGTGSGTPGYQVPLEVVPGLRYDREGRLGMARANDPDTAGGQFFITFAPQASLDPSDSTAGYTILGQVVEGINILRQITIRNVDQNPNLPKGDPLVSVRIVDLGVTK